MDEDIEKARQESIDVAHSGDAAKARRAARALAEVLGFEERICDEIALVASELASNIEKHAGRGRIVLSGLEEGARRGIRIEAIDRGPGIHDLEEAMTDDFSTVGSLGYGLGTVNRLTDDLEIASPGGGRMGTRVVCRRWLRAGKSGSDFFPLEFGAATRPHPGMRRNGDAFIIKRWGSSALVGVIDGLGHGQFAHRAAEKARTFVEGHYDQPLTNIFLRVQRECRSTRGVVMALARFDANPETPNGLLLSCASIGNVETRVFGNRTPVRSIIRRGILGKQAPNPVVTQHSWDPAARMVLFSDGIRSHWRETDFPGLWDRSATEIAREFLRSLARENDDATVVVVKGRREGI